MRSSSGGRAEKKANPFGSLITRRNSRSRERPCQTSKPVGVEIPLRSRTSVAVEYPWAVRGTPRVTALRELAGLVRLLPFRRRYAGPTRGRSSGTSQQKSGDNLPNVIQYLKEQHPDRLAQSSGEGCDGACLGLSRS